jgi:hypothetical protein
MFLLGQWYFTVFLIIALVLVTVIGLAFFLVLRHEIKKNVNLIHRLENANRVILSMEKQIDIQCILKASGIVA